MFGKIFLVDLHYSVLCVALTVVRLQNICWQQWMIFYKSHSVTNFRANALMHVVLNIHRVCIFSQRSIIKCLILYINIYKWLYEEFEHWEKETDHTGAPMLGNCLPLRFKQHCTILVFYSFLTGHLIYRFAWIHVHIFEK